jgi:hypothetical protein
MKAKEYISLFLQAVAVVACMFAMAFVAAILS